MRFFVSLILLLSVVVLVGCGGQVVTPAADMDTVTQSVKSELESIVETGDPQLVEGLQSYIQEDLAAVDQAKSDALMKDYEELKSMSGEAEIKAKAQEMISKL